MAIVSENSPLHGLSGKVGNFLFKQHNGKTVVTAMPVRPARAKGSRKKSLTNQVWSEANDYARSIVYDPEKKAAYAKKLPEGQRVYNAAMKEYMATHWIKNPDGTITYLGPDGKMKTL